MEIGVTVCNPDIIDIPYTATDLRGGTWVTISSLTQVLIVYYCNPMFNFILNELSSFSILT